MIEKNYPARGNNCCQGRVEEFHNRLKRVVKKLTCDKKTNNELFAMMETMDPTALRDLVLVLNGELQQVIGAVEQAK